MDPSTSKRGSLTHAALFDQLRPGLLGKIGNDAFLHARTERLPSRSFPRLHFHILGETVDDLRLVAQGAIQKPGVLGFQPPTPNKWWQRLGLFPSSGVFCQNGSLVPQTSQILRLVSTLKPLHIVIHSLTCTRVAVCGTRFSPKNHATVEIAHAQVLPITVSISRFFAHRIDLCGRSLRGVALMALRLPFRMRFHWLAAHFLFPAAVSIPRSVADVHKQMGIPSFVDCRGRRFARQGWAPPLTALPINAAS